MNDIIKKYLLETTLEQLTEDWKNVRKGSEFKNWLNTIGELEASGDETAGYIHSLALRCISGIYTSITSSVSDRYDLNCQDMESCLYTDENFAKTKQFVKDDIAYNIKHSRGKEQEFYKKISLEKYF